MRLVTEISFLKKFYRVIILSFLIFIFPALSLYANNHQIISLNQFDYLIFLCFIFFLFTLLISKFFNKNFEKLLCTISFFWWLQYFEYTHLYYYQLKDAFYYFFYDFVVGKYNFFSNIFMCYFIFCYIALGYLFFKYYNKYVLNFLLYFLLINMFALLIPLSKSSHPGQFENIAFSNLKKKDYNHQVYKNAAKNNIYFLLMDEMPSSIFSKKNFNLDYDKFLNRINSNNFNHYDNSRSFSTQSVNSLSHIFLLDKNKGYKIFQARFSSENKIPFKDDIAPNEIPLFNILKKNSYDKYWFANGLLTCSEKFLSFFDQCVSRGKLYVGSFRIALIDFYSKQNLFLSELFAWFLRSSNLAVYSSQTELNVFQVFFKNNLNVIKNKKNFFFIHNLSPHHPIRTSDCGILYTGMFYEVDPKATWVSSIECALNQIVETVNLIKKNDPNSIIIIQADHGNTYGSKNRKRSTHIFNFIEFGDKKECKEKYNLLKTNVAAIRASLSCLSMIK